MPEKSERSIRLGVKQGIVPMLLQMAMLVGVILEFLFLISSNNGAPLVFPQTVVAGETTDPNLVRFIYMFCALAGAFVLVWLSEKKCGGTASKFWVSLAGGILLWQAIGECSWHFGLYLEDGSFCNFPCIEGVQGTFMLLIIYVFFLYTARKGLLSWSVKIFALVFIMNWLGHWILEGIAPWLGSDYSYGDWYTCAAIAGFVLAALFTLRILLRDRTKEARMYDSVLLFTVLGMGMEGLLHAYIL